MDKNWAKLSAEERREQRFAWWLSPQGMQFTSAQAEADYKARVTRIKDAIELEKAPDRVPVVPFYNFLPASLAGYTPYDIMNDYDKLVDAWNKYAFGFQPDAYIGAFQPSPARVFEALDYKLYDWPGHGVAPQHGYQCKEAEYMKAEDYDALIEDPTDFWLRTYLPRTFGALAPLAKTTPLREIFELPITAPSFIPFGLPDVQEALRAIMAAGDEALRWAGALALSDKTLVEGGYPTPLGGATKAPFDILGDTLRGTRAMVIDLYRRPEKVLQACERLTPLAIKMGVGAANASRLPLTFMPLHKGADGFMSDAQFKTFYWPTLRKVIMGLIDEGITPFLFAEGGYNSRLEVIRDVPKGKTVWMFDQTDMAAAKAALGDVACIMGNVPITMLEVGTPEQMVKYCQELIDVAGKGGGFILSNGAVLDVARPQCLRAMIECAKKYGAY